MYKSLPSAPSKETHPHAYRWYNHIASYEAEHPTLPGDSNKSAADYVPALKTQAAATEKAPAAAVTEEDDDEDVDLFGSDDEEDAEAERVRQERLKAYAEKKAAKPKTIAKSLVTLDVKPWDDETDMKALEESVRSIEKDGLVWGSSTLVPVGGSPLPVLLFLEANSFSQASVSRNFKSPSSSRMTRFRLKNYRSRLRNSTITSRALILRPWPNCKHVVGDICFYLVLSSSLFGR